MKATMIQNQSTLEIIAYKINDKKVSIHEYHEKINWFTSFKNSVPMMVTRRNKNGDFVHDSHYLN